MTGMVTAVDDQVKLIKEALETKGLWDDTILLVQADVS